MPCSYCRCTTHNRQRCDSYKQDIDSQADLIVIEFQEEGREITRDLAVFNARKLVLKRKHIENIADSRVQRRRVREQRRQVRIENLREQQRQRQRQRQQQRRQVRIDRQVRIENLENLREQRRQERIENLREQRERFGGGLFGFQEHRNQLHQLINPIYRNMNETRLARTLHNNFIPREQIKVVEKVEKQVEATECAICMEEFSETDIMVTQCGHKFHSSCMFKHLQNKNNCPCCRGVLF
jgi:hypothetical protein